MPRSGAERARRHRQKLKDNPITHAEYLQKERKRYQDRKANGKRKGIEQMGPREQRRTRRKWSVEKRNQRQMQQMVAPVIGNTPPASPTRSPWPVVMDGGASSQRQRGRKKVRKDRSKVYRDLSKTQSKLELSKRLTERYKKRLNRLKNKSTESPRKETRNLLRGERVKAAVKKTLLFHHALIIGLRNKYRQTKLDKEKQLLSKIITSSFLKKYRLGAAAQRAFRITKRRTRQGGGDKLDLKYHRKLMRTSAAAKNLKRSVEEFLERDDNSRIKTGKKDTITKNGEKRQRRLLVDTLQTLHSKFMSERTDTQMSYSLFCRLRPFHILHPTERDRETCLCKRHENLKFKAEKLQQTGVIQSSDLSKLAGEITCDVNCKECMYRECKKCKDKTIVNANYDEGTIVEWYEWKSKRVEKEKMQKGDKSTVTVSVVVKEKESGAAQHLLTDFQEELQKGCKHLFNINHQYRALRSLKEKLTDDDIIIHVDFSENYACKYESEIQSMHFGASQKQITLHTGMVYTKGHTQSFCSISDSTKHGPAAIWAHLTPVIQDMKARLPQLANIYFITDGPTTQYRCKDNFYLLATKIYDMGFRVGNWNFLEAGHGKGAPDGIGAAIKREADRLVAHGKDINDAKSLRDLLEGNGTSIKLYLIEEEDVLDMAKEIPDSLKAVQGTMKIHQVCKVDLY
jgi:hypothetical protein